MGGVVDKVSVGCVLIVTRVERFAKRVGIKAVV